jgi:hypothetical protein
VNWSAELVALVPPAVVTVTCTVPLPAGEVAVIWVSESTAGVTEVLPKWTVVAPSSKPVPVIVTEVPPVVGPEFGLMPIMVGASSANIGRAIKTDDNIPKNRENKIIYNFLFITRFLLLKIGLPITLITVLKVLHFIG